MARACARNADQRKAAAAGQAGSSSGCGAACDPALTAELLELCDQLPEQRTDRDLRFIRDRLHERSPFFRLWPPQLQRLLCTLAETRQLMRGEVFVSQGEAPQHLFFLATGQASVCVREPGRQAGRLKPMAALSPGDTFGEVALLGAARQPAFVRVETPSAAALAVDAARLAALMQQQQQH